MGPRDTHRDIIPTSGEHRRDESHDSRLYTLMLDMLERLTIVEQSIKFADMQRLEISNDLKQLLNQGITKELLEKVEKRIQHLEKQVGGHQSVFALGSKLGAAVWGIVAGAVIILIERFLGK